jgi:Reverse transcriptase (RNA-dependent DNA polymerase)
VYKIKYHSDGTIWRYKARLIAKDYTQTYGIDYEEIFTPIAKMNTVWILLSIAKMNTVWVLHQRNIYTVWVLHQMDTEEIFTPIAKMNIVWVLPQIDVRNIFLQVTLEEEVYMPLPPGYTQENNPNLVRKLNKSIYGLKQSPRAWYRKLNTYLFFIILKWVTPITLYF